MNENDFMNANEEEELSCDDMYLCERCHEEYIMEQEALPAHKRDGWAERLYEIADEIRKERRENGK